VVDNYCLVIRLSIHHFSVSGSCSWFYVKDLFFISCCVLIFGLCRANVHWFQDFRYVVLYSNGHNTWLLEIARLCFILQHVFELLNFLGYTGQKMP
jgi:hypothetical protein